MVIIIQAAVCGREKMTCTTCLNDNFEVRGTADKPCLSIPSEADKGWDEGGAWSP